MTSSAPPAVELDGRKRAIDIPQLAFATGIACWVAWYCLDAWHASPALENMIMILPVSIAAILLYCFVAAGCFHPAGQTGEESVLPLPRDPTARAATLKIAGSMVLFVVFAVTGPLIGFDVACFAYVLVMLAFLGERRILVLLLVPLLFSAAVIYCFGTLLSAPLPALFFRGGP